MFEVFGPLARPTPSVLPLLLALLPLVGTAAAFGDPVRARRWALGALFATALVAAAFFVWSLGWPSEQRMLLASGGVAARIGQLDLAVALALDPLGAVAAAAGALVAARLVFGQRNRRRIGLLCAMTSAIELVVLADGAGTLVLAFGIASLVGAALGYVQNAHFVADRIADVATLGAAAVLFWALGGSWVDGQYAPEFDARVVLASAAPSARPVPIDDDDDERPTEPLARSARASLTFGGLPGAWVLLDGSWLRDAHKRAVIAPFADVPISAGPHTVRLHVGPGADDFFIPRFDAAEHQAALLAERGSTTTFRELQDDLVWRDTTGATPGRAALARRHFFGYSAAAVVLALLALAFGARLRLVPFAPSASEPARALAALGALVVVARFPIGALAPHTASALAAGLASAGLVAAVVALRTGRSHALLGAELALAGAGAFAGAPAVSLVHAALACLLLARERPTSPLVHLGLLPTRVAIVAACTGLPLGGVAAGLVLAASWFAACALARRAAGATHVVAAIAGVAGVGVAFDPRTFGGALPPLAATALAPSFRVLAPSPSPSLPLIALTVALVAFAYVASRTRGLERFARTPAFARIAAWAPLPARATGALTRAIALALVELESRAHALVRAGDYLVRGVGSLLSLADDTAVVAPTRSLRIALPPDRALRIVLVPVALAAAALFAVPWAS